MDTIIREPESPGSSNYVVVIIHQVYITVPSGAYNIKSSRVVGALDGTVSSSGWMVGFQKQQIIPR